MTERYPQGKHVKIVDLRTGTDFLRQSYQNYLSSIDEVTEIMKERGLFRKPVSFMNASGQNIISAEITQDARLLTLEEYGRFFKTHVHGEYHLRDLTEMLGLFKGKKVTDLNNVSQQDISFLESFLKLTDY